MFNNVAIWFFLFSWGCSSWTKWLLFVFTYVPAVSYLIKKDFTNPRAVMIKSAYEQLKCKGWIVYFLIYLFCVFWSLKYKPSLHDYPWTWTCIHLICHPTNRGFCLVCYWCICSELEASSAFQWHPPKCVFWGLGGGHGCCSSGFVFFSIYVNAPGACMSFLLILWMDFTIKSCFISSCSGVQFEQQQHWGMLR